MSYRCKKHLHSPVRGCLKHDVSFAFEDCTGFWSSSRAFPWSLCKALLGQCCSPCLLYCTGCVMKACSRLVLHAQALHSVAYV